MRDMIGLIIGTLAMLALDIYLVTRIVYYFRMKKHGIRCTAVITRLEREVSSRGVVCWRPWIEYTTGDGTVITSAFENAMQIKSKNFDPGNTVTIYYDKDDPERYIMDRNSLYTDLALMLVVTVILACLLMILSIPLSYTD